MFQVAYEWTESWPKEGPLRVDAHFSGEINVAPDVARRRANGYFTRNVAMFITPGEPVLILGERPVWRMPAILRLRQVGEVAVIGSIDVDAKTGRVIPFSEDQITCIQARANDIATRLTLPAIGGLHLRFDWFNSF